MNRNQAKQEAKVGRRKRVAILGATGSIGLAAAEVCLQHADELEVVALSARSTSDRLVGLIRQLRPSALALTDSQEGGETVHALFPQLELQVGEGSLLWLAQREDIDLFLVAVVGIAGLQPTLAALDRGKTVALATKEVLVAAGPLILKALEEGGGQLIPVDSEHSAIFQCLQGQEKRSLRRILLTASGGPFRGWPEEKMAQVTVEQAMAHPTWRMGPKITIDSATLLNKGLEVIEAHYLFDLPPERIEIVIHPQSIVHSLVEFQDGALLAQLSLPDMRLPIQYALLYPRRLPSLVAPLDLTQIGRLDFHRPDLERFPALRLAYTVLKRGGAAPAILSAADEVAVQLFLDRRIGFLEIIPLVEQVLSAYEDTLPGAVKLRNPFSAAGSLEEILAADHWARQKISEIAVLLKRPPING
ncbi:MAG: 1-deoxy-D-xylulose-5-phosphate reductoisomerase [Coprothermobacterota bacterium]|nr:1-deoxy-D-xylulose-5-phosphate reductoisomerase [Coprothermobacterota bacterium]